MQDRLPLGFRPARVVRLELRQGPPQARQQCYPVTKFLVPNVTGIEHRGYQGLLELVGVGGSLQLLGVLLPLRLGVARGQLEFLELGEVGGHLQLGLVLHLHPGAAQRHLVDDGDHLSRDVTRSL